MRLHDIAHSRAGDKGNTSDLSLIVFDTADYPFIAEYVTAERVATHFGDRVRGPVLRYELPQLGALKFVLHDALAGGVTRSLELDIHGKSLSSSLLAMELPDRTGVERSADD
ncbi:MAG: hypothetical protein R2733_13085 [Acidimicrobiales bacterium]